MSCSARFLSTMRQNSVHYTVRSGRRCWPGPPSAGGPPLPAGGRAPFPPHAGGHRCGHRAPARCLRRRTAQPAAGWWRSGSSAFRCPPRHGRRCPQWTDPESPPAGRPDSSACPRASRKGCRCGPLPRPAGPGSVRPHPPAHTSAGSRTGCPSSPRSRSWAPPRASHRHRDG